MRLVGSARRFYATSQTLLHEIAKFGAVGAIAYSLDVGLFNLLVLGPLDRKPLLAKLISMLVAVTSSYFMNRHWTFRHRAYSGLAREYPLFFVLSTIGLGITLGCLAFSEYVLDQRSLVARNIAGNVLGVALAAVFRFWSYRRWVFRRKDESRAEAQREAAEATMRTLAPMRSQISATALTNEIFVARNALEACLMSSAVWTLVTSTGTWSAA